MRAYDADLLTSKEIALLRVNVFEKLDAKAIQKQELEKHDLSVKDRIEHLKNEQQRLHGSKPSEASVAEPVHHTPPSSHSQSTRPTGRTPYLGQRLPEAVEAERRRSEHHAAETPSVSSSSPPTPSL